MKRRDFLATAAAAGGACAFASGSRTAKQPNILYILADQWRASATGYAGDPNVQTPNLDRLAAESLNFVNTVSVCPVCTPHRASLMTGRFPTSTGMFLNDAALPSDELCMAEIFAEAGYETGYIGKWHLDGRGRHAFIPPDRRQGWEYWKGAECDHNYNNSHYYTGNSPEKRIWPGYDAFAQTKDAQQYLKDRARGRKPFIFMLSYGGPHFPHETAPQEYKALYPPAKIKLPPNVPLKMQAMAKREAQGHYAHCTAIDKCIGDLLTTLQETGLDRNTIVIFTSDHGESMGSHGLRPKFKHTPWNTTAGVPFLMRHPDLPRQARTVQTPVTTPDILPTLLSLAGIPAPKTLEGDDLAPAFLAGREIERAALYQDPSPFGLPKPFIKEYRAIRTRRYTYARGLEGPWMLYDNDKDPHQMNNLVAVREHAGLVKELDTRLQEQLDAVGDTFRPAQFYLDEWGFDVEPGKSVPISADDKPPQMPKRQTV
jgi:arylsulfatase A-like enzyme